jgi:exosortase
MTHLAPPSALSLSRRGQVIGFAVVAALIWGGLIRKLTTDWSTNPQYEFGYFVPFFILYLLARRWQDRPAPVTKASGSVSLLVLILSVFLLLPIGVVQEANPDWRPLNWVHAAAVVAATLALIARAGGVRWVTHFGVPLLLVFFCLPWPLAMEQGMIQYLTGAVTRVTVELLNWVNVPALQRGNVIEVAAGSVGVADACSGMRSLAGTLMASAFFGEYYRLSWPRRAALLLAGSFVAFGLNIIRTFFLGWRTAAEGGQAVDTWHDPAGYTIFAISFAALWLMARVISRELTNSTSAPTGTLPDLKLPLSALAGFALWLVSIRAATEWWYRFREGERISSKDWTVVLPQENSGVRDVPLPADVRSILRYSEASSAFVDWPDGRMWNVIVLRWEPGRSSAQLATMHRPEICLPAAGYTFLGPAAPLEIPAGEVALTFDGSVFQSSDQRLHVYRCLWEERAGAGLRQVRRFDMSIHGRLMSSWYGRRNLGQKLVQVAIFGAGSEVEARDDFKRRMPRLIIAQG